MQRLLQSWKNCRNLLHLLEEGLQTMLLVWEYRILAGLCLTGGLTFLEVVGQLCLQIRLKL